MGATSAAQTTQLQNDGNAALTIQSVLATSHFSVAAIGTTCVTGQLLAGTAYTVAAEDDGAERRGTSGSLLALLAPRFLPALGRKEIRRKVGAPDADPGAVAGRPGRSGDTDGCGRGTTGLTSQQPSTYTVTVTATSGALQHNQNVTLTVQ